MTGDVFDLSRPPRASVRSDVGLARRVNEDSFLAVFPLYLVADGMGGHERGDLASSTAVRVIQESVPLGEPVEPAVLLEAVRRANDAIRTDDAQNPAALSGTTLTGLAVARSADGTVHWMVVNVGDSRVYSWNGRALSQLTVDHSVVQELVDSGDITSAEAENHPERNTITRALGVLETVEVDAWLLPYSASSTYLVCSDGVTKELGIDRIEDILSSHSELSGTTLADAIVDAALLAGGRDNITAIVLEATESSDAEAVSTQSRRHISDLDDTRPRSLL